MPDRFQPDDTVRENFAILIQSAVKTVAGVVKGDKKHYLTVVDAIDQRTGERVAMLCAIKNGTDPANTTIGEGLSVLPLGVMYPDDFLAANFKPALPDSDDIEEN